MKHTGAFFLVCLFSAGAALAGAGADSAGPASAVASGIPAAVEADVQSDPTVIVRGFYDRQPLVLSWDDDSGPDTGQMSKRLLALYAASQRRYAGFAITFDPVVNGQDASIEDLVVHPALIDGDSAYVHVRFRNFDARNVLVFSFVYEDRAWRLDEIASIGGAARWLFSDVLQNP